MRNEKTYNGELMTTGKANEEIIMEWLRKSAKEVIDFREFRLAQRIDVDCGIETLDGDIVLAEIKSDKWISESGNLCFENNRINHFVKNKWFYLGWGWRSPAQKIIIRNPESKEVFIFNFQELRSAIANYIAIKGRALKTSIIETDKQKTTFVFLVPMSDLKGIYKKFIV